jgi:8-oxo-dGTP pyrophosphatase MutT (NUDIX family)
MPGAMVVLEQSDGRILLTRRADDGTWSLPAGAAEPGGSFVSTAAAEVEEEVGVRIAAEALIPFASLSDAATHTIRYANGDVTHCFALCFLATRWDGDPRPDGEEVIATRFAEASRLPELMHAPSVNALRLLSAYRASGRFQAG